MPLNASGAISLGGSTTGQSVNLELGKAATAQIGMNDTNVRTLTATTASTALTIPTNFYGKSNRIPVQTTFNYTGSDQSYTVPSGVTSITIALWGAGGGSGGVSSGSITTTTGGGGAGSVQGTISVTAGEVLTIRVGQAQSLLQTGAGTTTATNYNTRGYGGGGASSAGGGGTGDGGGSNGTWGAPGGGSSAILRGAAFIAVAAGGGGGGGAGFGSVTAGGVGGAGGTGTGTTPNSRPTSSTFWGTAGNNGSGGGGTGGSGSSANLGAGLGGAGGANTVPSGCTGYNGSGTTAGNTGSVYYGNTAGRGGISTTTGGAQVGGNNGRVVIFG